MLKSPYAPELVVAATAAIITVAEARSHCHIDDGEWDALLEGLIAAALAHVDGWSGVLGRCLKPQTWRVTFDCFERCLRLPFPDAVAGSVEIIFVDAAGDESAAVGSGNYDVLADATGSYVRFRDAYAGPSDLAEVGGVRVAAQYAAPDAVAAVARPAMLLMVGHWFANREAVSDGSASEVPMRAQMLLAPVRRVGV